MGVVHQWEDRIKDNGVCVGVGAWCGVRGGVFGQFALPFGKGKLLSAWVGRVQSAPGTRLAPPRGPGAPTDLPKPPPPHIDPPQYTDLH